MSNTFLTIMIEFKAIAHKNLELLCPDTSFGHTHVVTKNLWLKMIKSLYYLFYCNIMYTNVVFHEGLTAKTFYIRNILVITKKDLKSHRVYFYRVLIWILSSVSELFHETIFCLKQSELIYIKFTLKVIEHGWWIAN